MSHTVSAGAKAVCTPYSQNIENVHHTYYRVAHDDDGTLTPGTTDQHRGGGGVRDVGVQLLQALRLFSFTGRGARETGEEERSKKS